MIFVETYHFCLVKQVNTPKKKSINPTHAGMTNRTISKASKKHEIINSVIIILLQI